MTSAGQIIAGRYELVQRIGSGGMGEVWHARDTRLHRDVAIKLVNVAEVTDGTVAERFRRETIATAGLTHPNIVTVYDAGSDGSTAFLVMELLRGRTLLALVRKLGPLPLSEGLGIGIQVADALSAAHQIGIIHRDVKPANIIVTDGRAKVLDFGIARLAQDLGPTLTAPATALGTAAYMAPEQASGQRVSVAADVYALGCLLMTIFSGRPPFIGEHAVGIAAQQLNALPPRLSSRRPDVPPALDDLVARMLSKAPQARPTAREVVAELRRIQADPALPRGVAAVPVDPTLALPDVGTMPLPTQQHVAVDAALAPATARPQPPSPVPTAAAPGPQRRRRGLAWLPWVIVALLLAGLVTLLVQGRGGTPTQTSTTTVRATTKATATRGDTQPQTHNDSTAPATTATPTTPATSATNSAAGGTASASAAVQAAIDAIDEGTVESAQAKQDIQRQWAKAVNKLNKNGDAAKEIERVVNLVEQAQETGALSAGDAQNVLGALETLQEQVDG